MIPRGRAGDATSQSLTDTADLLVGVLKWAGLRGASAADGFLVEERQFSATVRVGEVETVTHSRDQRLSLRVFVGKASAAASTSDLSRESLARVVDEATALARVTAEDPHAGLPDPAELIARVPDLDLEDTTTDEPTPEEKIAIARRAEAAALESDPRIANSEGAEYGDRRARYAYATSHGFAHAYRTTSFSIAVSPIAVQNGDMQRDYWYSVARKRARLDDPAAVGRIAAARALRRLGARKVKTTEVPVVFDPENAASLVRAIAGAASGPSLYRRASFLTDRLGSSIAASAVTIVDDGLMPGALGSRPFDGEGLATRRTPLVSEGVLTSYLLDSYSARKLGLTSTHHAARDGAGVTVSSTNLMLLPGPASPGELIASVKNGLYVTELIGFGVNGVTGDYSRGAAGLWIENGQLAYPVEEVTIAGNLLEMFAAIDGVADDLTVRDRTASPTIKIARMVVAGS
jgi:PmbA protein